MLILIVRISCNVPELIEWVYAYCNAYILIIIIRMACCIPAEDNPKSLHNIGRWIQHCVCHRCSFYNIDEVSLVPCVLSVQCHIGEYIHVLCLSGLTWMTDVHQTELAKIGVIMLYATLLVLFIVWQKLSIVLLWIFAAFYTCLSLSLPVDSFRVLLYLILLLQWNPILYSLELPAKTLVTWHYLIRRCPAHNLANQVTFSSAWWNYVVAIQWYVM